MKINKEYRERPTCSIVALFEPFKPKDGSEIIVDPRRFGTKTKLHITLSQGEASVGINLPICEDLKYHKTTTEMNYLTGKVKETTCLKYNNSQGQEAIEKHVEAVLNKYFSYLKEVNLIYYSVD